MAHQFESGVFCRGLGAWHGLGHVTTEKLTPFDAFTAAEALFPVAAVPMYYENPNDSEEDIQSRTRAVIRTDNGDELGNVAEDYEVVSNDRLLEMADAVSEHVDMDTVIVLAGGTKVAFTGLIRDTTEFVLPGDRIDKFLCGWLGHDGRTGIGSAYTNTRAVCANTLAVVMESENRRSIVHKKGANLDVTNLIKSIEVARQGFGNEAEFYRCMAEKPMSYDHFRYMLEEVFTKELQGTIKERHKPERFKTLDDLRVMKQLDHALRNGRGTHIPGVMGTAWGGYNALTEVLTSGLGANGIRNFNRVLFGVNRARIETARSFILNSL